MKNQPNDIAALGSLLPLSKEQLSQLSDGWQSSTDATAEQITQFYRSIGSLLTKANEPDYPPKYSPTKPLKPKQYQQLLTGWRQRVQQLLNTNSNDPASLTALAKACHYLWQGVDLSQESASKQQRLWYLAELWLQNLAHNQEPLPQDYVPLLSGLDQLLETSYQQTATQQEIDAKTVRELDQRSFVHLLDKLLVTVYINMSTLATLDDASRALIEKLSAQMTMMHNDKNASFVDADTVHATADKIHFDDNNAAALTAWQAAKAQVQPDVFDMNEEIRQIFIEEATESLAELTSLLPVWQQDIHNLTPLKAIHHNFYTLKGSGRIIGAFSISEIAYAIENILIHLLDQSLPVNDEVVSLIARAVEELPTLIANFSAAQPPQFDPALIILQSHNLLAGLPLSHGMEVQDERDEANVTEASASESQLPLQAQPSVTTESDNIAAPQIPAVLAPFVEQTKQMPADADDADPDIKEIFIEEAYEVLEEIMPLYDNWQLDDTNVASLTDVRRGFHTLKGSGRMVGANYSAELAWALESMLNRWLDKSLTPSDDMKQLVADVLAAYPEIVNTFAESKQDYPAMVPLWVAAANAYSQQLGDEFSYSALAAKDVSATSATATDNTATDELVPVDSTVVVSDIDDESIQDKPAVDAVSSAETMLKNIHSINDMMTEKPIVIAPQSGEEREILDIFVEEAKELLQQIDDFISTHQHQPPVQVSEEIVRAFHTLRAASGSNALAAISDVSATIEKSLEHLQKHDTPLSAQHIEALAQSVALIKGYLDAYEGNIQQHSSTATSQSKQDVESLQAMLDSSEEPNTQTDNELSIEQLLALDIDTLLDAEWQLSEAFNELSIEPLKAYIEQIAQQISRLANSTAKSPKFTAILTALADSYHYLTDAPQASDDSHIQAALLAAHTHLVALFDSLAGRMSFKVNQSILDDLQAAISSHRQRHAGELAATSKSDAESKALLSVASEAMDVQPVVESISVEELQLEAVNTDVELLEIFLEEAQELDSAIAQTFNQWRQDVADISTLKILQRHLHTIKGGARMAGIRSIGDLTHAAESIYEAFINEKVTATLQWVSVMQMIQDTLSMQLEYVARYQQSFWTRDLIEQLDEFEQQGELPQTVTLKLPILKNPAQTATADSEDHIEPTDAAETISLEALIANSWSNGLPDIDILDVFLEEAEELVENSQKYLQLFLNNTSDVAAVQTLQRDLHTIKGGARMVAANGIADLAHQMESVYESLAIGRRPATKVISELLISCHDWLKDAVFVLKHHINPAMPTALINALQDFSKDTLSSRHIPAESLQTEISAILAVQDKQSAIRGDIDIRQMPAMSGSFAEPESSMDSSDEMIRISGSLVEHMINLSGESAINRARIDMGMSSLTGSIGEMSATVQRLADQLRRMEIELEAQILSQIDEELIQTEDFDPLEMDQYSSLNQLSKSLSESASDLIDINNTLLEKTRDNENLLLQLSRTQTELQDGLMNSRMVPFLRLKPRLDLIVRQTANELNKSVDLTIITADDELDRTILERITSPLEHMLRNAVDHGIESPQERLATGKDRSGHITLEVLREGSEVVIHLTDDGRGIDVNEVREKAVLEGLINPSEYEYTDVEIMQYVFNAGVTTSKQVTQISGRGVGMDVVASEIRQLGGAVSVSSKTGEGTRFTMRIPLTVAVSDALVVRVADRYYAIPLIQIERVVRVNPEALYDYYHSNKETMQIEDKDYRIRYLNELILGSQFNELMMNTNISLPVIIVKNSSGQNLALQVDQIAGSRIEVVVKPMGQQLSHLDGISAATIMGDGSVMLILDIIALLRQSTIKTVTAPQAAKPKADLEAAERKPTILVVDDSVTVRKVTSRFLERQGLNAVVAKDGVDAMEILQQSTPDLILLDIEMPRMDGFEVATQVRNNQRLQQIPIIMITSRTGDKHRTRAFETGVNDYMGKPFQESELLEKIQTLLNIKIDDKQQA